jgi:hypothetical protein
VLTLEAPEALRHALRHNGLANGGIHVFEIAPVEQARAEPVPVEEAVAGTPLLHSSWQTESSSAPERGDGSSLGIEQLLDNPVTLSSVEVDLDRIQIDTAKDRQTYDQSDQAHGEPAPAINTAVTGLDSNLSSLGRQTTADAPTDVGIPQPASQPAGATAPPMESVSGAPHASPTDPSGTSITQSDAPLVGTEPPSDRDADTPDEPAPSDMGPSEPPIEQEVATRGDDPTGAAPGAAEKEPDVNDAAPAGPTIPEGDGGEDLAGRSCTFALPGEDVIYQPTASFSGNSDLHYALPTGDTGESSFCATLFDLAQGAEVIDLEAMCRVMSEATSGGRTELKGTDFMMMRVPDSEPAHPSDGPSAHLGGEAPVTQDHPGPDQDETLHNPLINFHTADV